MIDCENEIFDACKTAILTEFSTAFVSSEVVKAPPSMPHVSIIMIDNPNAVRYCVGSKEYVTPTFEVQAYSVKQTGKKTECKQLINIVDTIMRSKNFTRELLTPVMNLENDSIYRLVARYSATFDGNTFYNRG